MPSGRETALALLQERLRACRRCPRMQPPPICGEPVPSPVLLVGQAPGVKEPQLQRPFAWTAGRTLFSWFEEACGMDESTFRARIYMAAVCRCFPGKTKQGGDRVPAPDEIGNCADWLEGEAKLLRPRLILPIGKLAINQFLPPAPLTATIGQQFQGERWGLNFHLIPLPHPSGASPWPRIEPGKRLLAEAMRLIVGHEAFRSLV